jgi:hypothetical protein
LYITFTVGMLSSLLQSNKKLCLPVCPLVCWHCFFLCLLVTSSVKLCLFIIFQNVSFFSIASFCKND